MSGVFICYRREDTSYIAGRLHDRLSAALGPGRTFRDIDAMGPGVDFAVRLNEAVASCDALLAVIGDDWLTAQDPKGGRRIDNPDDWVRLEIDAALERGILVVPVLVENATMPTAAELPAEIRRLAGRNAMHLSDQRWDYEVGQLIDVLRRVMGDDVPQPSTGTGSSGPPPRPVPEPSPPPSSDGRRRTPGWIAAVGAGVIAAVIAVVVAAMAMGGGDGGSVDSASSPSTLARPETPLQSRVATAADFPSDWTSAPATPGDEDNAFFRCVTSQSRKDWEVARSPVFTSPDQREWAYSWMYKSDPGGAAALFDAYLERFVTCVRSNSESFLMPGGRLRSVDRLSITEPAGVRVAAFRFVIDAPAGSSTEEIDTDVVLFQRGDYEGELVMNSKGRPFPFDRRNVIIDSLVGRLA